MILVFLSLSTALPANLRTSVARYSTTAAKNTGVVDYLCEDVFGYDLLVSNLFDDLNIIV